MRHSRRSTQGRLAPCRALLGGLAIALFLAAGPSGADPGYVPRDAGSPAAAAESANPITLVVRDTDVREVFEMLSKTEGASIAMGDGVEAQVSISLFDVGLDEAIRAVAQAAGYGVDRREDTWIIVEHDQVGQDTPGGVTQVRSFEVHYSETDKIREVLENHLSRYGVITALEDRRIVVVEDQPAFLARIERILAEIDQPPTQILLEAKVLEVSLDKNDTLGIDWSRIMEVEGTDFTIGTRGLTTGTAPGLFFNVMNENLDGAIEALTDEGRVRALASPQLLTAEHQEAEVLVGERLGFRVTTTINQVTTESVEFIDSGVILRFTPSVDRDGRILLEIHPEVSTGVITDGIPSVTTTEVTTRLLAEDGERIFIGGLIRDSASESRRGVPLLSRIPGLGMLFSRSEWIDRSTETIVIVRASIRDLRAPNASDAEQIERLRQFEPRLDERRRAMEDDLDLMPWLPEIGPAASAPEAHDAEAAASETEPHERTRTASEAPPADDAPAALDWMGDVSDVDVHDLDGIPLSALRPASESAPIEVPRAIGDTDDLDLYALAEGCLFELYGDEPGVDALIAAVHAPVHRSDRAIAVAAGPAEASGDASESVPPVAAEPAVADVLTVAVAADPRPTRVESHVLLAAAVITAGPTTQPLERAVASVNPRVDVERAASPSEAGAGVAPLSEWLGGRSRLSIVLEDQPLRDEVALDTSPPRSPLPPVALAPPVLRGMPSRPPNPATGQRPQASSGDGSPLAWAGAAAIAFAFAFAEGLPIGRSRRRRRRWWTRH